MSGNIQRMIVYNGNVFTPAAAADNQVSAAIMPAVPAKVGTRNRALGLIADYASGPGPTGGQKVVVVKSGQPQASGGGLISACVLSRGSTDTALATTAFVFWGDGTHQPETRAADAVGLALPAGTIPLNTWGSYRLSIAPGGTRTLTPAAANFTTGYASEAAAIAAVPAAPAGSADVGYFTVQTKTGATFVGGTDALNGGASGNVANATNYYPTAVTLTERFRIRHDFSNFGALNTPFPAVISGNAGDVISAEMPASGNAGTDGLMKLFGFVG